MKRKAEFYYDNEIGKIGENGVKTLLESRLKDGWSLIDVSDDEYFQKFDIDQIQVNGIIDYEYLKGGILEEYNVERIKHTAVSYEIKTDTYIARTRNATYEIMVKDHQMGYALRSAADFILYAGYNEKTGEITDVWVINMRLWKRWCVENENNGKYIKKVWNSNNEGRRFLLNCNIDKMVKDRVAVKWV